jgi:hypothetical protein
VAIEALLDGDAEAVAIKPLGPVEVPAVELEIGQAVRRAADGHDRAELGRDRDAAFEQARGLVELTIVAHDLGEQMQHSSLARSVTDLPADLEGFLEDTSGGFVLLFIDPERGAQRAQRGGQADRIPELPARRDALLELRDRLLTAVGEQMKTARFPWGERPEAWLDGSLQG